MSKRISEGERQLALLIAHHQADVDVSRVHLENHLDALQREVEKVKRLLAQPPFAKGTS
jgi:hypothetical protein